MSLLEQLKKDNLTARKNRDVIKGNLLTTLVSEASMIGKNNGNRESTDEEVIRVVKKFLDNAKDTLDVLNKKAEEPTTPNLGDAMYNLITEISILEAYMPEQFDEAKLKFLILTYKEENPDTNVGHIMKYLQVNYAGQYDGKLASKLAKEALS